MLQAAAQIQPSRTSSTSRTGTSSPTRSLSGVGRALRSKWALGARSSPSTAATANAPASSAPSSQRSRSTAAGPYRHAATMAPNSESARATPYTRRAIG